MEDYIKIIDELNRELIEKNGESDYMFSYMKFGTANLICFQDEILWCSDAEDRCHDDIGYYPQLIEHIKDKFNEYADDLQRLKF
jgi:hypothetical protein